MTQQIILIDQSLMKRSRCLRDLYYILILGLKPKFKDHAVEFGQAFHTYTKALEVTGNHGQAVQAARKYFAESRYVPDSRKKYLNDTTLIYVCSEFHDTYYVNDSFDTLRDNPTEAFPKGEPIVEKKFVIDFYNSDTLKVIVTGTLDKLAVHRTSKLLCITDYKTTASWDRPEFFNRFKTDCQLMVYTWALAKLIKASTPESIFNQFKGKTIGCFIDGIFVNSPVKDSGAPCQIECKRSDIMYHDSQACFNEVENELMRLVNKIEDMINLNSLGRRPPREGIYNGSCYGCQYNEAVCPCEWDVVIQDHMIEKSYVRKPYNPMEHGA